MVVQNYDIVLYYQNKSQKIIAYIIAFQDKMIFFALVVMLIICGIIAMVKGIRGSYTNVVGLPLSEFLEDLLKIKDILKIGM